MNLGNSMSLRARINNFAKSKGISPQLALQSFFAERFLARVARSPYVGNFALKGGTLMSAILGIEQRTTMDIDATIIGIGADETAIAGIVEARMPGHGLALHPERYAEIVGREGTFVVGVGQCHGGGLEGQPVSVAFDRKGGYRQVPVDDGQRGVILEPA